MSIIISRFKVLAVTQIAGSLCEKCFVSCAAGTGSGCVYQSVCTAMPVYFDKYRSGIPCIDRVLRQYYDIMILGPLINTRINILPPTEFFSFLQLHLVWSLPQLPLVNLFIPSLFHHWSTSTAGEDQ